MTNLYDAHLYDRGERMPLLNGTFRFDQLLDAAGLSCCVSLQIEPAMQWHADSRICIHVRVRVRGGSDKSWRWIRLPIVYIDMLLSHCVTNKSVVTIVPIATLAEPTALYEKKKEKKKNLQSQDCRECDIHYARGKLISRYIARRRHAALHIFRRKVNSNWPKWLSRNLQELQVTL